MFHRTRIQAAKLISITFKANGPTQASGPMEIPNWANILFTTELARRLEGTGVTANALHPGLTSTGFGKNNPGFLMKIMGQSYL